MPPRTLIALTRAVSPSIANCELSFIDRQPIDFSLACRQHHDYEQLLTSLDVEVVSLPPEPNLPDSMFVEDAAIVLDELAIIFPLGVESRRREAELMAKAIARFRGVEFVTLPGVVEGGDLLRIGRTIYAGLSARTNRDGVRQLRAIVSRFGYEVICVSMTGCLHLKTAVTSLGNNTLLANREWFDASAFSGYRWIDVDRAEPHGGNSLLVNGSVIYPTSFPRTLRRLEADGFRVLPIDISELQKAEAGLTCSSLIFEWDGTSP